MKNILRKSVLTLCVAVAGLSGSVVLGTPTVEEEVTVESVAPRALEFSVEALSIGSSSGGMESIDKYSTTSSSGETFYTDKDVYISIRIRNETSWDPLTFDCANFKYSYQKGNSPFTAEVIGTTKFTLAKGESQTVTTKLPDNWWPTEAGGPLSLYFVYAANHGGQTYIGTYRIKRYTKANAEPNIQLSALSSSDVAIKSLDESPLKSITVINANGSVEEVKNYSGNISETNLNLSDCKNGLLYIMVVTANGTETVKYMKK